MIRVKQFEYSIFEVHTYLAIDIDTNEAAVIDPAMDGKDEEDNFDKYVADNGIKITQIINTHLHLDHCFGFDYVKSKYGVVAKAHPLDAFLGNKQDEQRRMFGLPPTGTKIAIDVDLKDGDEIQVGNSTLKVIHVPGHSPGGIALYCKEGKVLFSGDSLFQGSIGRTDLWGDYNALISNIKTKLFTLPDNTLVLPGHGPHTTIGQEKATNPYFK